MAATLKETYLEIGATNFGTFLLKWGRFFRFGGTVRPYRLVKVASDGDLEEATAGDRSVVGFNAQEFSRSAGDMYGEPEIGVGFGVIEADVPVNSGERLKSGAAGRPVPLVDSSLAGDTIHTSAAGGNFGNQPANDGVEVVSSSAADDSQSVTIYGTTQGTDTVVKETVALDGTTPVATTKVDWGVILGVELSAACAGTVTVREASADQTITTIAPASLSAGVEAVAAANQRLGLNVAPVAVAGGASTKQVGLIGTNSAGTEILDSQALNGTTPVTMNSAFRTITKVLDGDIATATATTVSVGAEEDEHLSVGKALSSAAAQGDRFYALILPH